MRRPIVLALLLLAAPAWAQGPAAADPVGCSYAAPSGASQGAATLTMRVNAVCTLSGYAARWQVVTSPRNGTATVSLDGVVRYEPNRDFVGDDAFAFAVGNPMSAVGRRTIRFDVVVQREPVAAPRP
jgi:hypothetical protein